MSSPKISVIIPVYNAEEFLEESITSVLNQTFKDIELVCVNDGSKDNSLEMLNNFAKKDSRVKVIDKPNGGCGSARNMSLDNATGEYVYFFDPDDYVLPDAFEKLYNNAISNNSDLVMFKIARFRDGEHINYNIPGFNFDEIFTDVNFDNFTFNYKNIKNYVLNSSFAPWSKFYKKEFLDSYDDFRFDLGVAFDDVPFHVKSLLRASRISFVPEFFYHYRLSNPNSVNNTKANQIDIFKICDLVENFLVKENYLVEFFYEFIDFKITQILNYVISSNFEEYFQKTKKEFLKIKKNYLDKPNFDNSKIPKNQLEQIEIILQSNSLESYKFNLNIEKFKKDNPKMFKHVADNVEKFNEKTINFTGKLKDENQYHRKLVSNFETSFNNLYKSFNELKSDGEQEKEFLNNINSDKKPLISVIMPSLNVVEFIRDCIESVINQTLKNIEIICVDAGSDDGTLEILQEYEHKDSRVKIINSTKKSYGHQMNLGIHAAQGEYIGIVETDDYIKNDMFEILYDLTEKGTVDIAKANFWHVDTTQLDNYIFMADGTKKNLPAGKFTIHDDANILNGHPSIWTGIYRKKFLIYNNIKFLEAPGGGWVDNPFLFDTLCAAKSIKYKDEPVYCYRETNPNSSTNNLTDLNLPMKRMINNLDVLKKHNITNERVLAAFYVRIFWHIRDVRKKEDYKEHENEIYIYIKKVLKRVDENIVKKYFSADDQKLYYECLNYPTSNLNVLFMASDNNKTSGAFLSMGNLCVYLRDKYGVNVSVVVPMEGHGVEVLDKLGIEHTLIQSHDWVVPLSKNRDEAYQNEVKNKRNVNKVAVDKISEHIKNKHIDLVHINTTYSYVGALSCLKENIPFVWHLREFLEEDQSNTLWNREKGNALINKSNRVVAISDSIFNKYKPVIDDNRLVRIYNGIDATRFYKPYKQIFNNRKVRLIFVGGFEYYKGQIEFAKACAKVFKRGYDNFEIWFVGMGRLDVKQEVKEIFDSEGMYDYVKYLGYKYDVENYYSDCDISFTCAKSEAFGRTTVEAMLSGNLLIGADTAGTKELIDDNTTGILYKHGDSDDLAQKIIFALNNPHVSKRIANNGRQTMFENMTAEINADNVYELYQDIINEKEDLNI